MNQPPFDDRSLKQRVADFRRQARSVYCDSKRPSLLVALGWTLASFVFAALVHMTVAEIVGNLKGGL